jgi:Ubiquitin-like modifier-activating enzyme ATG7 N-terminus
MVERNYQRTTRRDERFSIRRGRLLSSCQTATNNIKPRLLPPPAMPVLQFTPFSSLVQPEFWHQLTNLKIDVLRLSDDSVPVNAFYSLGRTIKDRESGQDIPLGCNLSVGHHSFTDSQYVLPYPYRKSATIQCRSPPNSVRATGLLKNFNTIEDFKASDKIALADQLADEVLSGYFIQIVQTSISFASRSGIL